MTFQEKLNLLRAGGVPLPLMPGQATAQALRLRSKGLSYSSIAVVMDVYHGSDLAEGSWRRRCRENGAPVKRNQIPPHQRTTP